MYPHPLDRWRVLQRLVRAARLTYLHRGGLQRGLDQRALARRAGTSQSTISNLENLETAITSPHRRVGRDELLKILGRGLEMGQKRVSALLWLYDGIPLTSDEFRHYVQRDTAEMYISYSPHELREVILHELRSVIQQTFDITGKRSAQVEVFSAETNGVIAAEHALLDLDTLPGHRMTMTALPSQLTYPPEWYSGNPTIYPPNLQSSDLRAQWLRISKRRYDAYLQNLIRYGGRSIYSKTSIEHYLTTVQHPRYLRERIAHMRYWIRLIETHDAYEVGLTGSRPDLGLAIKSTKMAMLRAVHPYGSTQVDAWPNFGPRCILWMDETSVLQFLLDFEIAWDMIPAVDRNKDNVVAWLSELIQRVDR